MGRLAGNAVSGCRAKCYEAATAHWITRASYAATPMAQTPPKWLELVERSFRRVFDRTVWARRCGGSVRKPTARMDFGSELSGTGSQGSCRVVLGRRFCGCGREHPERCSRAMKSPFFGLRPVCSMLRVGNCYTSTKSPPLRTRDDFGLSLAALDHNALVGAGYCGP